MEKYIEICIFRRVKWRVFFVWGMKMLDCVKSKLIREKLHEKRIT